jgi:hypothetical protein
MSKKSKNEPIKVRSAVARAAYERNGAGTHRSDRRKPRSQERREAIRRSFE